jgi:N-acetylglucosamine kinase-like BadF-type ATPase
MTHDLSGTGEGPEHPSEGVRPVAVALEGGGSKTVAVAVDASGAVVAWGQGGSSLILHAGEQGARQAVDQAVGAVAGQVNTDDIAVAAAAMVGRGYSPDPTEALHRWFPHARIKSVHEGDAALLGATLETVGVVVISGTGSCARAVGARGTVGEAGGNGPLVGDEGSAHHLAVEGMRRALWAEDGRGRPTVLADRFHEHFGVAELKDACRRLYGPKPLSRHEIAALAPIVVRAADEGDAAAAEVLEQAAEHLAGMVVAVVAQVRRAGDGWPGPVAFGCSGGVLLGSARLRSAVVAQAVAKEPALDPREPCLPPIGGVALAALDEVGVAPGPAVAERLAATLPDPVRAPRPNGARS